MGYILKKKECAGELSKTKRPERPQKITKVFDCRILCLLNKNHHDTKPSKKQKKTTTLFLTQEVSLFLSQFTINRCIHKYNCTEFTTRGKTLVTLSDVTSVRSILMCRGLYSAQENDYTALRILKESDLNPVDHSFQVLRTTVMAQRPINKKKLKVATVMA